MTSEEQKKRTVERNKSIIDIEVKAIKAARERIKESQKEIIDNYPFKVGDKVFIMKIINIYQEGNGSVPKKEHQIKEGPVFLSELYFEFAFGRADEGVLGFRFKKVNKQGLPGQGSGTYFREYGNENSDYLKLVE